jgi:hypothetical protein
LREAIIDAEDAWRAEQQRILAEAIAESVSVASAADNPETTPRRHQQRI